MTVAQSFRADLIRAKALSYIYFHAPLWPTGHEGLIRKYGETFWEKSFLHPSKNFNSMD
jgi:hypothetical protein